MTPERDWKWPLFGYGMRHTLPRHPTYIARHAAYASTASGIRVHGIRHTPRFYKALFFFMKMPVFDHPNLFKSI